MLRKIYLLIIFLLLSRLIPAQQVSTLTIGECYDLAGKNSPLYQQKLLTAAAGNLSERNQNLKWLPQIDFNSQASHQSAVTSLPIKIPNVNIEELDKNQYKGTIDLLQPVYDGGVIAAQKKLQQINTATETQKVEVDLYQLRSVINNYYFTALLMERNISLMALVKQDLDNSIKTVQAQILNGVATKSDEDLLTAEQLKTDQQVIEFSAARRQAMQNLAVLTGTGVDDRTVLVTPVMWNSEVDTVNTRPELKLFGFQQQNFQQQSKLTNATTNAKLAFFADGGYGKPGLNLLKNEFQWFYITGFKLNIPVMGRITRQKDREVFKIREQAVQQQKANFLTTNQRLVIQQKNEILKYGELIVSDSSIMVLRKKIKENAFVKLSNGIITSDDYIRELNAESQALLNRQLHEVALLQSQYNYKVILGK